MKSPRLKIRFVPVTVLDEADIRRMGEIRYESLPTLSGRTPEEDLERFRGLLRGYLFAGLAMSGEEIGGFVLFNVLTREWKGRYWQWMHAEDAAMDPRFRGGHTLTLMALEVTLATRLRNPLTPIYGLSPLFPPTYLHVRSLGRAWAWGDPSVPPWQAGLLDYMAPEIAADHPLDREKHVVQLQVTSGSKVPPLFKSARHRAWFEEYEQLAPEWQEGRVPIILYPISVRKLFAWGLRSGWEHVAPDPAAPAARRTAVVQLPRKPGS